MTTERPSLQTLDQWLRAGRLAEVAQTLTALDLRELPADQLADWSNLARRAGLLTLSLRLLQPVVRLKESLRESATPKERACYAAALAAIGALAEARQVLSRIEHVAVPEVQLFSGFVNTYSWDYRQASPFFERYLELEGPTEFQKAVARTNLSAASCFLENYDYVRSLTGPLIEITGKNNWFNLQSEAYLIAAQAELSESRWPAAEESLKLARNISTEKKLNLLHVQKWELILALHREGPTPQIRDQMQKLITAARTQAYFEIERDCHYHLAVLTKDKRLLEQVYFGTPFAAYRERLLKKTADWYKPASAYRWQLHGEAKSKKSEPSSALDLTDAKSDALFLRVLRSLTSDFYRPLKIGCLFNEIYPNEYYDIESSPTRVKTALSRARASLRDSGLPIEIKCLKQDYYLSASRACAVRVRTEYPEADKAPELPTNFLKLLKARWSHKSFSSAQVAELLELSPARAQKLLKIAADKSRLYKSGVGRARVYRFRK